MARKKKPVDAEFSTIDMNGDKPMRSPVQQDSDATVMDKLEDRLAGTGDVRPEIAEKLAQFEKLERVSAELTAENQALKDRLAEYIQTAASPKADQDAERLRAENDEYLMRISELTFENAKLHAEIDRLKQASSSSAPDQTPPRAKYTNIYRNGMNGYSSWN